MTAYSETYVPRRRRMTNFERFKKRYLVPALANLIVGFLILAVMLSFMGAAELLCCLVGCPA